MLLRKLFLFLFILLQGLGPLLHAHAGTTHHGGIHLPDGYALGESQEQEFQTQASDEPAAVTVETSLEARGKSLAPVALSIHFRLLDTPRIASPPWVPVAVESPLSLGSCHLIPRPCAPPRV